MKTYHKIQTVFKRDPNNNHKTLLEGEYSLPEFDYLANNEWEFTEKVDGTNIRIMTTGYSESQKSYGINFGGRSDNAQIPAPLVQWLEEVFHCDDTRQSLHEMFPEGVCLYGEGYGGKIQKAGATYGPQSSWGDFQAEGYVARPTTEMRTRRGDRMITKIKCKDFE